jgi:hypothetical protein
MRKIFAFLVMSFSSCCFVACSSESNKMPNVQQQTAAKPAVPAQLSVLDERLNRFLWDFEGGDFEEFEGAGRADQVRYQRVFVDLNGDGKDEAVVYFSGSGCGSGGCSLMILTPTGDSFDEVGYVKIVQPPIRVLDRQESGWHNLAFSSRHLEGEPELKFNGEAYEENAPGDSKGNSGGKTLIDQRQASEERTVFRPADTKPPSVSTSAEVALREAVQDFERGRFFIITRLEGGNPSDFGFRFAFKDLNGDDNDEAIVYLNGPDWWRHTLILTPKGAAYAVVGSLSMSPPLHVLSVDPTSGWTKLSGWSPRGGGDWTLHETRFSFDGKRYVEDRAGNASNTAVDLGETVMEQAAPNVLGEPLFPKR